MLISTLKRYVEAMGGQLDLIARFPNRPAVVIGRISERASDVGGAVGDALTMQRERGYGIDRNPLILLSGGLRGVRTPVYAVRGRCPRPLDDGTGWLGSQGSNLETVGQSHV